MKTRLMMFLLSVVCAACLGGSAFGTVTPGTVFAPVVGVEMGSSSPGRAIGDGDPKADVVTPDAIYHINDESGGAPFVKGGHSAVIIPGGGIGGAGCTYYSYGGHLNEVEMRHYNNITDALAKARAAGYTREEHWDNIGAAEATAARAMAASWDGTEYGPTTHNCCHMVLAALKAAGLDERVYEGSSVPNMIWDDNHLPPWADGWNRLKN